MEIWNIPVIATIVMGTVTNKKGKTIYVINKHNDQFQEITFIDEETKQVVDKMGE